MEVVLCNYMYENLMLYFELIDNFIVVFQIFWEFDKFDKCIIENMRYVFNEIVIDLIQRNLING